MKTENLTKALDGIVMVGDDLRAAHSDTTNQFAEIILFDLLQRARALEAYIQRALSAATPDDDES